MNWPKDFFGDRLKEPPGSQKLAYAAGTLNSPSQPDGGVVALPEQQWAVIETNILIVANGKSDQANGACMEKCIDLLVKVSEEASVALDRGGKIFDEYSVYCDYSGEPGTGDEFFVWVHENKWTSCQTRLYNTP